MSDHKDTEAKFAALVLKAQSEAAKAKKAKTYMEGIAAKLPPPAGYETSSIKKAMEGGLLEELLKPISKPSQYQAGMAAHAGEYTSDGGTKTITTGDTGGVPLGYMYVHPKEAGAGAVPNSLFYPPAPLPPPLSIHAVDVTPTFAKYQPVLMTIPMMSEHQVHIIKEFLEAQGIPAIILMTPNTTTMESRILLPPGAALHDALASLL